MKHFLTVILSFVFNFAVSSVAESRSTIYGFDYWAPVHAHDYLQQVDAVAPMRGSPSCQPMYQNMLADGVLDIRYALGYFDDSTGKENIIGGVNWGYSPSLDIVIYEALRQTWTAPCQTRSMRLCGFSERGSFESGRLVFTKNMSIQGQKVQVRITLTKASASESFERNKGELKSQQRFLTQQSEENFFGGLRSADIVFYNGHSRDGGGPDFDLPILNSLKKTNYKGYYHIEKPGIKKVMAALEANPNKGILVGFFSCYARLHFFDTFMNANPSQRVILSAETIDYFDALKGSLGYLEGLLRGSCGQELNSLARQGAKVRNGFQGFNLN